ncbi:CDPK-RELATED KINASE 3 [Salix koriyanagi]|uniref:non-specific serine/threonine protein kinase n=1 Tax=Salix koriyanagi TaxID=2511006 RepID=A0A9Q0WDG1_9ROSI|nr:CDPK-RELATED KINASE 3 [Salix koriyanagi]
MGHCCSKDVSAVDNEVTISIKHPTPPRAAAVEVAPPPVPPTTNEYANSFASSPFQSPLPAGVRPSPSPARTPGRKFRWPLPPPSPAKPIMAIMRRRGQGKQQPITVDGGGEGGGGERVAAGTGTGGLDKSFGYPKNFSAKYELGKEVGRGHFGHTCWAKGKKGERKGQSVAVKIISKAKMTTAISIEDVRREVKILKALSGHTNIIKFYDAFEDESNVYIVMELCEGGELLDRILSRGGRYTEVDAKTIVVQILNVVAYCHLQGVAHRDLKPENFLFTSRDEDAPMRMIDFGLSDFVKPVDPNFDDSPWPAVSPEAKDFVKRLLNKDHRKRMTAAQALTHPWLRDLNQAVPLDILIFKLVKSYVRATPFKRAALKALSKAIPEDELVYLRTQFCLLEPKNGSVSLNNFKVGLTRHVTDAMKESRVFDILNLMEPLAHKKMAFDEFCAAAISTYQLEALEEWENIAAEAFGFFEQEGNQVISVEELAQEMNLGPAAYSAVKDWIRSSDGKLNFLGYTKFLHGVTMRISNARFR